MNQCDKQILQASMRKSAVNAGMQAKAAAAAQEERLKRIEEQSAAAESKLATAEARAAQAEARLQVPATQSLVGLDVRSQNNFSAPQETAIAASWTPACDHQSSWGALHLQLRMLLLSQQAQICFGCSGDSCWTAQLHWHPSQTLRKTTNIPVLCDGWLLCFHLRPNML